MLHNILRPKCRFLALISAVKLAILVFVRFEGGRNLNK